MVALDGRSPTLSIVTLTLTKKMRSKFRGHEISIGIVAFRLSPPTGELLVPVGVGSG